MAKHRWEGTLPGQNETAVAARHRQSQHAGRGTQTARPSSSTVRPTSSTLIARPTTAEEANQLLAVLGLDSTAVAEGPSSPAWMERTIAASSWETAFEANDSWCTTPASSWLPTRDGPNCDGEAWECEQSIGWPYDQPGSDLNWSRSKWHGRYATERSKNWKQ